ncbi:MAG: Trm112 family protein [Candidatus Altiarchaeales archaeon]|nr:Trm112 family protein [Candidatus Altiarchaeales archaeon]MBD3416458.1 Trm112 family protein [Candidatus Altiarchaeales archaeon]
MTLDKKLLDILACPKCKGDLEYKDSEKEESLTCHKCKLKYKVEDNIPIMLVDEAEQIQ